MGFEFKPAVRENVSLLIALAGPSGSGKTMSALRLAQGISPSGNIGFLDTEARRALHYAPNRGEQAAPPKSFAFQHEDMRPPFRPASFMDGIQAAERAGVEALIIDSFSHEYDGEGGILDWASELEQRGTKPPANWKEPKLAHKRLMNAILQVRMSLIFCLRADEKIAIEKREIDGRMKTVVVPLGWQPICEKRFMYEMTASFTLTADNPGKPNFALPHKLQEQHRAIFPEGLFIDESAGCALAEWARGGIPAPRRSPIVDDGDAAAARGTAALQAFWTRLTPAEKREAGGAEKLAVWKREAEIADKKTAAEEEGTSATQAAGNAEAGNDVSRDGAPAAEPNPWFEKGRKAAADGMSRKAIPPELRPDNRHEDLEAYLAGFDSYGAGAP